MNLAKPAWAYTDSIDQYVFVASGRPLEASDRVIIANSPGVRMVEKCLASSEPAKRQTTSEFHFSASGIGAFVALEYLRNTLINLDSLMLPQPERRKALLVCDMDSTIIQTESLDELAEYMGIGEKIAAITARAMNGELDFHRALHERVALLSGLPYSRVHECVQQTRYNSGARELLVAARTAGLRTVLVSGGFAPFVEHVADDLGFDRWVANQLEVKNQQLTGKVIGPVVDKDTKLEVLMRECQSLGIQAKDACTIGDGANDIEMLVAAGFGVAYRAKPVVLNATPYHLQHAGLDALIDVMALT